MPFLLMIGQWLLSKALPWILHQIGRAWGVFIVGLIVAVILMRFHAFKLDLYNEGYKKGYNQALTDHPSYTVQSGGQVVNVAGYDLYGLSIDGWGFGFVKQHRNASEAKTLPKASDKSAETTKDKK